MPTRNSQRNSRLTSESMVTAASGFGAPSFDPSGKYARWRMRLPTRNAIDYGLVVRSGPGGYDCSVKVGQYDVPCAVLQRQSSQGFGLSTAELPVEGSTVLVWHRENDWSCGVILGSVPRSRKLTSPEGPIEPTMFAVYPEEDTNAFKQNMAYETPYKGKPTPMSSRLWSNAERFGDVVPGESFSTNENMCGLVETMYDVELTGGASFIRVGRVDDEIRMRSTNFTKWTNHQAVSEFNDGGYVSAEGREYSYQGEYLGDTGLSGPQYEKPEDTEGKEPRPRTRWWKGFLGNLFSWFVVRARKTPEEHDTGLASIHVSQAGNVMARAAGGISLERYDAIPVPKRLKEPWDPEGDKEVDVVHTGIKPFDIEDPHAIGLLKSSKMAWEQKSAYQRFDELEKDFDVQEEADVDKPTDDDDDPTSSNELKLSEYQGRKAGVFIGEDGSVIIRDAWGSEIVMVGGNVLINTPGNVVTTANRSVVSIAGQSVALRGVKSADMSSDEGHVHIHSKRVVEIAGGSDKTNGGVLIESLAKSSGVLAPEEAGDSAVIQGVVIRSEEAGVSLSGKNAYLTGHDNVFVTGGDNGDERDGNVFIDGETVIATGAKTVAMVVKTSACLVSEKSALLGSDEGSALVAGKSAMIINGKQIPMLWISLDEAPDLSQLKDIWDTLQTSDIIQPMDWKNLVENAVFSFRKSSELMVEDGLAPWEPGGGFRMYEPYWQVMKDLKVKTVVSKPVKPEVEEVHGTKCWPGKDAMESGKFVTVSSGDVNVEGDEAVSKSRNTLSNVVSVEEKAFTEFQV